MRVALTHAFCWPEVRRGGERLVAELSAAMATLGHDVTVFSSAFSPGRSVSDGMRWVRLRRSSVDTCRAEADFGRRVLPALLAGRFDVVHAFGRRDGVASLRAAKVHPSRLTAYTDIGVPERAWWEARGREADYVARVVRDVDLYGCMSRYALDFLERDYGRVGVLTPGGVDLDAFAPGPPRTEHPTILFSGAVDQLHKGVGTLVDALPLVARAFPDVRLVLSGPGDPAPVLAAASAPALDRIDLVGTGELAEQRDRYASAWCCALPSWGDTFGLALLEALACGTPIVASDHAALPELVAPGLTGAICVAGDAASVAAACTTALGLAALPGTADACRESARPYDWRTAVAPRYLALYESAR